MREIILITVSGRDRPGLTAALTDTLSQHELNVLDIGQAVIHDALSLGIVVEVPPAVRSAPILKDLLYTAHQLGLDIHFVPIHEEEYERWVVGQGQRRYIVTLLGRRLTAHHLSRVATVVAAFGLNIDTISRLSSRYSLRDESAGRRACVEFSLRGEPHDVAELREAFLEITREEPVDLAVQEDDLFRRNRRLIVFNMDATLISTDPIDEMAAANGVAAEVAAVAAAVRRRELGPKEGFLRRVALLKGLEEGVLREIAGRLTLTEGAERLLSILHRLGYKIGILSNGFTWFAHHLQDRLGIDYVYANQLDIRDGRLTGEVKGEVVDGNKKAELLQAIAKAEGVGLNQTIAVGDGVHDLPMLKLAGLGIAFHTGPGNGPTSYPAISTLGLDGILYLIGVRDREVGDGADGRTHTD